MSQSSVNNLTIEEFLAKPVPDNVAGLDETKIQNFIGPNTARHLRLKNEHNIWVQELAPVFRKMDLLHIAKAKANGSNQMKSVTGTDIMGANSLADLHANGTSIPDATPDASISDGQSLIWWQLSEQSFSSCHDYIGDEYDWWVDDIIGYLQQLDDLISNAAGGPAGN